MTQALYAHMNKKKKKNHWSKGLANEGGWQILAYEFFFYSLQAKKRFDILKGL
jgi:hypothetical protein